MNTKTKNIIISILTIVILALSVWAYSTYNKNKNRDEMNKLITITNDFFKEYAKKGMKSYEKLNMTASYEINETQIVAGDENEFLGMVYFEVNVDVNGENDYTSSHHKMRIKKESDGKYKLVEEGGLVTADNLELVNYSSNDIPKKDLSKEQKYIDEKEVKKSLGIYYKLTAEGLQLSYDRNKSFVDVPISKKYLESNLNENKLKENTCYITHKKTAFISNFNSDILITITNDKGETWSKYEMKGAYQGGDMFIGFANQEFGYCVITTDVAMGKQYSYVYVTTDGGKTFKEIGNTNETYPRIVTGVGFLDENIGFIGFRYESDNNPTVYRTENGGMAWKKLNIKLPTEYNYDYATPLNLKFNKDTIMLPVKLRDNDKIISYISTNKGLTFEYSEKID